MENNEGESHDRQNMIRQDVYNMLMRETQDILSFGASATALEYDIAGDVRLVVGSLLLAGCLG